MKTRAAMTQKRSRVRMAAAQMPRKPAIVTPLGVMRLALTIRQTAAAPPGGRGSSSWASVLMAIAPRSGTRGAPGGPASPDAD